MRLKIRNLCLLIGALVLVPVSVIQAAGFQSYENRQAGLRLGYPAGWIKSESTPGVLVAFGAPKEKANLKLVENVTVVVQDLTPDVATLEKYTAMYDAQRKKDPSVVLVESKKTVLGGLPAQRIVCTAKQGGMDVKFMQVWTVRGKKAYLCTYGAAKENYATFLKEAEGILRSLEFI